MPRKSDNPRLVSFTRLPNGIQQAGIAWIEFKQKHGVVTDLVQIPEGAWSTARWRFNGVRDLVEQAGPIGPEVKRLANLYGVSERTLRRWMMAYRKNPDVPQQWLALLRSLTRKCNSSATILSKGAGKQRLSSRSVQRAACSRSFT